MSGHPTHLLSMGPNYYNIITATLAPRRFHFEKNVPVLLFASQRLGLIGKRRRQSHGLRLRPVDAVIGVRHRFRSRDRHGETG